MRLWGAAFALLGVCALSLAAEARPIVILAGVPKAGTSSVAAYLHEAFAGAFDSPMHCKRGQYNETSHFVPVLMPCSVEEVMMQEFADWCGIETYAHCWPQVDRRSGLHRRALEHSPDFLLWPHIPRVLRSWLAEAGSRVVVILRDPVQRALSDAAQALLTWQQWVLKEDQTKVLGRLLRLALDHAAAARYAAGRLQEFPEGPPRDEVWPRAWNAVLNKACEEGPDDLRENRRDFLRKVLKRAFENMVRRTKAPHFRIDGDEHRSLVVPAIWSEVEAALLEIDVDQVYPSALNDSQSHTHSFQAYIVCYLKQLFLRGLYLPQILSWIQELPQPWQQRLRVVQAEAVWRDPAPQLEAVTRWLGLGPPNPSARLGRLASSAWRWQGPDNVTSAVAMSIFQEAYRPHSEQLFQWLAAHPEATNSGPFDPLLWPSLGPKQPV